MLGRLSDIAGNLSRNAGGVRRRPGRAEKPLKHTIIVHGDNSQEFKLDCFFPFMTSCNVYST